MSKKIGQQGNPIARDFASAIENARNRYEGVYRLLHNDEFGHFYYLSEHRKTQILAPLKELLSCGNLRFCKLGRGGEYDDHYDFYLGQLNENGQRHGTGLYGWEWEEDDEGDTSITYFVGEYIDGRRTDNGVWYHFSSEDAKIYFDVEKAFTVYAAKGVGVYSEKVPTFIPHRKLPGRT